LPVLPPLTSTARHSERSEEPPYFVFAFAFAFAVAVAFAFAFASASEMSRL
jgi:hypothetical protein